MAREDTTGQVYLLHFTEPYPAGKQPQHYVGWAIDAEARAKEHATAPDARLLQVIRDAGIGFQLVRTWDGKTRSDERRIKNGGHFRRFCPICNASTELAA